MNQRIRLIVVALACAVGALALHARGGLGWSQVLPFAILSFAGAALVVRSAPRHQN